MSATPLHIQRLTITPVGHHCHDWHEAALVLRGQYQIRHAGGVEQLHPGMGVVIPRQYEHWPQASADIHLLVLQWKGSEDLMPAAALVFHDATGRMAGILDLLWQWHSCDWFESADGESLLRVFLRLANPAWEAGSGGNVVSQACAVLAMNLDHNIHMSEVAKLIGLSRSQLLRRFQSELGMSPSAYRRKVRIDAAITALRLRQGSIAEIAQELGLGSASYLSQVLWRERRLRPSEL